MNQNPGMFIAIAPSDARRTEAAGLPLPVATLSLDPVGAPVAQIDGVTIPAPVAFSHMVGLLSLSPEGADEAEALAEAWKARFGTDLPSRLALSQPQDAAGPAVSDWLIATLAEGRTAQAARSVQLQRDLGTLRMAHEATQAAFSRLETYVYKLGGPTRSLAFHLEPFTKQPPLILEHEDRLAQRLPICSAGMSDVAVWVFETPQDPQARLEASLELPESGEVVGEWSVPADRIHPGWNRLSRGVCLGTDRQTVILNLRWHGTQPLKLAQTMQHPDPRFFARHDGAAGQATLAAAGWISVAGASLPLPAGAVIDEPVYPRRWIVPTETMRAARNTSPEGRVAYSDDLGGLIVTPGPARPALARLVGAGAPGMQQIFCGVQTKSASGPVVEYALAVVPAEQELRTVFGVPDLSRASMTDWIALPVGYWAELQLFLEHPIETASDIYAITRVAAPPEGHAAVEIPDDLRCCFFSIRANA